MNAEQIQALLNGATSGPWVVEINKRTWGWVDVDGPSINVGSPTQATDLKLHDEVQRIADARLIAAAPDLAQAALTAMAERDALQARVVELEAFVGDFADAPFPTLPRPPVKSPEDEPDPAVDATEVWAWQADARALLKGSPNSDA